MNLVGDQSYNRLVLAKGKVVSYQIDQNLQVGLDVLKMDEQAGGSFVLSSVFWDLQGTLSIDSPGVLS